MKKNTASVDFDAKLGSFTTVVNTDVFMYL